MSAADYSVHGAVAVITLNNPPVNGLAHPLRQGLMEGLGRASADASVKAVVLIGGGNAFSGGADIREFNTPKITMQPTLHEIVRAIEASPKPVIAAIHKVCDGRGPRARARLPLPRRRARRADRAARSQARHPAGRGRHPAPAARGRRRRRPST